MFNNEFVNDLYDIYSIEYDDKLSFSNLTREEKFFVIKSLLMNTENHLRDLISYLKNPEAVIKYFNISRYPSLRISIDDGSYIDFEKELACFICEQFSCPSLIFEQEFLSSLSNKVNYILDMFKYDNINPLFLRGI